MERYHNPILPGFYPDPSLCRVGDYYYLTNSTFEYFPGLPIHRSKDLVSWELIGNALDRESQLPLKGAPSSAGLFAPTLRHWKGTFYLTCNNTSGGGNFIVTAKDAAGPWSEPMWMNDFGIDGDMFFDDDGKAYYTRQDGGAKGGIAQAEFDPATGKILTPFKKIWNDLNEVWNEGPHLYKIKGWYYLMLAEGGTGTWHMEAIGRSKSPSGPFEPSPHGPVLTNRDDPKLPIQCAGHADMVQAKDGKWWMVHLGTRPQDGASVLGRETFLVPLNWTKDGWPIAWDDHHSKLWYPDASAAVKTAYSPQRTLFNKGPLGPEWIWVRNPPPSSHSFDTANGRLRLFGNEANLDETGSPAFVGLRQRHFNMTAKTEVDFRPAKAGEEAGLCVRANDANHYEVLAALENGKPVVQARIRVKDESVVLASRPLAEGPLQLQISSSTGQYQFAFSQDGAGEKWTTLGAAAAADLSPEKAGGFTGAVIGLFAVKASADFAWFEYFPEHAPADTALSPRPTPTPLAASDTWRIRCGGGPAKDSQGYEWGKDRGFEGGTATGGDKEIAGTRDSALYNRERYGTDFSYKLPMKPGKYKVTLKFAEIHWNHEGERVFSVFLNGRKVAEKLDILAEAKGKDRALDRSISPVKPDKDGFIHLRFVADFENAKVSAIEVAPLP